MFIKQAVILSAGLGTRLRPLTDNIPKVMIPLAGKPLLHWHIEQFKKHGVTDFFINLHYLPDTIRDYFGDGSQFGVKIIYVYEPEIMGTAGGMKNFDGTLDDVFFLMYGDMASFLDYRKMADAFFAKPADALGMMVVGHNNHPQDSDLVVADKTLKFENIYIKPHKEMPASPTSEPLPFYTMDAAFVFRKEILKYIPAKTRYQIDHDLLPKILAEGKSFYGYETNEYLYDVGTMERYRAAEEYAKKITNPNHSIE
ncbi:MAG: nucleotidyltransferase family protein [Patescibacteria group bacterium]|nr:nucleotidyltransferase family protein [Patescibacteria group bacterium]